MATKNNTNSTNCYATTLTNGVPLYPDLSTQCPLGFYCPNLIQGDPTTSPVICPASKDCSLQRLLGKQCDGPQGKYEPMICQPGYYCSTPMTMVQCPEGFYCPTGTVTPLPCDTIAICPAGTTTQTSLVGITSAVIIDFFLIILFIKVRIGQLRQAGEPSRNVLPEFIRKRLSKVNENGQKQNAVGDIEILSQKHISGGSLAPKSEMLSQYFKKALADEDLRMNFKFTDLSLTLPNGKTVLQGVTGEIRSACMTAIMGPSGAGKTTFMNVLCGKVDRTAGQLWISGKEAEISQFKKLIGYVPQEDIMLRELTVRENILHSARIRLPASWTNQEIEEFTDNVIDALNLSHVAHTRIGDETTRGVSGGQRKRVNIAMELVAAPVCIFLDEPTSGLDSTASLEVVSILEKITELGITVVAVIHQPRIEIFEKFHDVLMIVPGGQTAYFGKTKDAQTYFHYLGFEFDRDNNPADELMDAISGKGTPGKTNLTPADLVRVWDDKYTNSSSPSSMLIDGYFLQIDARKIDESEIKQNNQFHEAVYGVIESRGAPFWKQVQYCHNRSLAQQMANSREFVLQLIISLMGGILMGLSQLGNTENYTGIYVSPMSVLSPAPTQWVIALYGMLIGTSVTISAAPAAVKVFGEERTSYWREAASGHSKLAYYLGKTWATTYRILIAALHFTAVYHCMARPMMAFDHQLLMVGLNFYGVYGLAAIISMLAPRENAAIVAVIAGLETAVFCGFAPTIKQADSWHMSLLLMFSYNRWTAEAQYSDIISTYSQVYITDGELLKYGFTLNRVEYDFAMAALIGTGSRVIALLLMIYINRQKQR